MTTLKTAARETIRSSSLFEKKLFCYVKKITITWDKAFSVTISLFCKIYLLSR